MVMTTFVSSRVSMKVSHLLESQVLLEQAGASYADLLNPR